MHWPTLHRELPCQPHRTSLNELQTEILRRQYWFDSLGFSHAFARR